MARPGEAPAGEGSASTYQPEAEADDTRELPREAASLARRARQAGLRVLPLRWPGGAVAACSITFDDGTLDQYVVAAPLLDERNMRATFFVVTAPRSSGLWWDAGTPRRLFSWQKARSLAARGHEIASHTADHIDLSRRPEAAKLQLARGLDDLRRELPGSDGFSFSWPYWRTSPAARGIMARYHGAARTGRPGTHLAAAGDPEDWLGVGSYGILSRTTPDDLEQLMDAYQERGGWLVANFHGFSAPGIPPDYRGWQPYPAASFAAFLDGLQGRGFWCAPFGEVVRHIQQREVIDVAAAVTDEGVLISCEGGCGERPVELEMVIQDQMGDRFRVLLPEAASRHLIRWEDLE